ncbi:hypothetical protein PSEUBRA_003088 [Kalmanozyma brasiliensis GHG001]|uniref:uncharacterized protein n=1 Tax=Kalmanozyma brasiliensis (strain GHG001) TaxID=1365824 RepID=UPI002867C1C3|nr:uncharacterized protein PSEUBRA_003088 [Kalmanozyma brasiliensis GHG001]KAF6767183.1 hypothetical protein PSEUBRA_003088 [Kalmanozyma brasiliensis GHG001]
MSPLRIPGSSEPYSVDAAADRSPPIDSDEERRLNAVPDYPQVQRKSANSNASTPSRSQSSPTSPAVAGPSRSGSGNNETPTPGHSKKKSIGSKLISKFKSSSTDDKAEPSSSPHSQASSGSRTPAKFQRDDGSDSEVKAHQLQQALFKEQQKRAKQKQASFGSMDGLRHRGFFGKKPKQAHQGGDVEEHDLRRDSEETTRYFPEQTTDRDRSHSDATRHFPGGLYNTEDARTDARLIRERDASQRSHGQLPRQSESKLHHEADIFAGEGDQNEDLFGVGYDHEYDSDDSDDTIAHLIREADGYDSLRNNTNGDFSAGISFDTLQAVRERSHSLSQNKDAQSLHSAYSGGASKALSQPLLELEDIELETFMQSFARHTKEITVTRPTGQQKYRMPRWDDFRVSPEDNAAADPDKKRPSMLSRVDRGLQHLSNNLSPNGAQDRSKADTTDGSKSRSTEEEGVTESASDTNALNSTPQTPSKKKSKDKTKKKSASKQGGAANDLDEDWDLIVPSSGNPDRFEAISAHDELRVNAEDEGIDSVAFCIAYILALVERLAPEEIEHHPVTRYREGLIRSHLERLYTIAPFWEQLGRRTRRLYRWEEPRTTAAAAMIYFVLWYTNMIPTAFILMLMFYIMRFKYFPPSESYLHDKVKMRMARGQAANTLSEKLRRRSRLDILNIYRRWIITFGAPTQEGMGYVADFHEKVKNLILWRNPAASRRTMILFGVLNLFVTFAPSHYISKTVFFFLGITFFCLLPLQSYFPSHRKALSPFWWGTFGAPTDAQFAVQLLRKRHLDVDRFAGQLNTADDVRRAVQSSKSNSKIKPRPDRREEGIAYDQIDDPSRASVDYVEMSKDSTLKPRKLGSFFCQYKGLPGRLHVNTKYLYFTPLHSPSQKRGRTPVEAIESIIKTKSIRLMVWSSLGLKIVRNNGKAPLLLANLPNRNEAFNLILAVTANAGAKAYS